LDFSFNLRRYKKVLRAAYLGTAVRNK